LSSEDVLYCNDTESLFGAFCHVRNPKERRLFMDLLKVSLKAVRLQKGTIYSSVPGTYSVYIKDPNEGMRTLLNYIDYENYR